MKQPEELILRFKERGYKMTPQRRAILEALAGSLAHPSAEEIYEVVRQHMPDTSLATVYNTLRELVAMEEVFELVVDCEVRRYDISGCNHAHLVCLGCGKIRDARGDLWVEPLSEQVNGFLPVRSAVTIFGYCQECRSLVPEPTGAQVTSGPE